MDKKTKEIQGTKLQSKSPSTLSIDKTTGVKGNMLQGESLSTLLTKDSKTRNKDMEVDNKEGKSVLGGESTGTRKTGVKEVNEKGENRRDLRREEVNQVIPTTKEHLFHQFLNRYSSRVGGFENGDINRMTQGLYSTLSQTIHNYRINEEDYNPFAIMVSQYREMEADFIKAMQSANWKNRNIRDIDWA